ncbi:transporter substrate-binding domain-containing protein [Pararhizobium sp. YC-54]|uniref:transporter substrate-binding domain-containing protein n=1 Tax=Pararhizobium sp. YC-54 TaxID=2986920 RepID=UPI0021F79662|nr:transporter substrate-binding domain-containing protein [Pararhizobium sp. YC-54]MCW0001486.1 transporter substrate-binding domain-containing protein [Pararhizobium sp. YC-54]
MLEEIRRRIRRVVLVAVSALTAVGSVGIMPSLAQETTMQRVQTTKQLRVGVASGEPWYFKDISTGEWKGIGIELARRLSEKMGVAAIPVETTWGNSVAGLQAGQIDIMFLLDPTEERKKAIDFLNGPIFYYALGALVKSGIDASTWEALDKPEIRVGVTLGASPDKAVTALLKHAQINRFASNDEAIAAFAARRVDVVVQFHPALVAQFTKLKIGTVALPKPVSAIETSAGIRKEPDSSFRDQVSTIIADFYQARLPNQLFSEYLKSKGADPRSVPGLVKEDW